ncbi:MAG: tetratricopeptide repeat protein [Cyanobacteria bacterium J06600_6]
MVSHSGSKPPLGAVLQQAGLVSAEQISQALKQQKQIDSNLRIGEILAIQGRIAPETANFFAEVWDSAVAEQPKRPIGQYLKQAALLDEQQIQAILAEQKHSQSKFGELAIAKGWLKRPTLDFFLRYLNQSENIELASVEVEQEPLVMANNRIADAKVNKYNSAPQLGNLDLNQNRDNSQKVHEGFLQIKRKLLKIETEDNYSTKIWERVLSWTGGHSLLTQKIFALIAQDETPIPPSQEEEHVDYLVQTQIIDNWSQNQLKLHLNSIHNRLISNSNCQPEQLLISYQKILTETVSADNSPEQLELINLGLVVKQDNQLAIANRIYRSVFNLSWVIAALNKQVSSKLEGNAVADYSYKKSSAIVAKSSSPENESDDHWLNLKNLLLLLALIALLGVLINNVARRFKVRQSFLQGNELLKQKSYPEAIDEYNKLLKTDSNYFQAWTNRGYALAGLQKYAEMRESCAAATIIDPQAVYAWNCQGEALHNLEKYAEAVTAFDRAIALNQDDPIFSINKSESLLALGSEPESLASIQQAIKALEKIEAAEGAERIKGEFAVALTLLGNRHRRAKNYQKAIAAYKRAIEYNANYFPARLSQGITLSRDSQLLKAKSEFELILKSQELSTTQQAQTWFHLGKTNCKLGQSVEGGAAFEQAIRLNPDYTIARDAKKQCRESS